MSCLAFAVFAATLAASASCGALRSPPATEPSYLTSAPLRRAALEASLVTPDNGYSRLRLAHYATIGAGSWDELPEWNPEVSRIDLRALERPGGVTPRAPLEEAPREVAVSADARRGDARALRALGEEAFFRYPVQLVPALHVALASSESAERYGLWRDSQHGAGGLVRVRLASGKGELALTCATCHARSDDDALGGAAARGAPSALVVGAGNDALDLGGAYVEAGAAELGASRARSYLAWGPGRVDVTTIDGGEPVRIPDLRPVRFLSHLHHDATLRMHDVTTLAIRLETLVIASNGATLRPPREIALGIATYLWSLGEALPLREPATDAERRGEATFMARCASCHAPPAFTGAPVPLGEIGTDDVVGRSRDRGTGRYRVPSLRGLSKRGALLHDGRLPSVDALLDPARLREEYEGALHGKGPVKGHVYGLELDDASRQELVFYLRTL